MYINFSYGPQKIGSAQNVEPVEGQYISRYGTFIRWLKIPCDPHLEFCMSQHMFDTSKNNASLWVRKTCAKKEDCKATQGCKSLHNQTQVCTLNQGQLKIWTETLPPQSHFMNFKIWETKGGPKLNPKGRFFGGPRPFKFKKVYMKI